MTATILVVDDDESLRTVLSIQLKRLGFLSQTAEDGAQAITSWIGGEFALILMDVQMPRMDGLEATIAIRELERAETRARIPIVGVTANPDRERCFAAGMDAYLFKPVLLNDLKAILDRWLTSARDS